MLTDHNASCGCDGCHQGDPTLEIAVAVAFTLILLAVIAIVWWAA